MVSRRNYFSITVIMCIIFFLFQFTNAAKEHWNEYGVNDYAKEEERPSLTQILAGRGQEEETWEGGEGRGHLSEQDGDKAGTGQMTETEGNEAGDKQAVSEEKASAKLLSGTLLVIGEQEGSLGPNGGKLGLWRTKRVCPGFLAFRVFRRKNRSGNYSFGRQRLCGLGKRK